VVESDQDSDGNPRFTVRTYREPRATDKPSYLRLVSDNDNPPKATNGASNSNDDEQG